MRGPPKGGKILDFANITPHPPQAVPLKVNCRIAAREATLGCPLKGKVNPIGHFSAKSKSLVILRLCRRISADKFSLAVY